MSRFTGGLMANLATTLTVDKSPKEVFTAITNVGQWWTGVVSGNSKKLSSQFRYRPGKMHDTTQRVTVFVPGKKLVWHVTKGTLSWTKKKTEWVGTDIVFSLSKKGSKTQINFKHLGLNPKCECYKGCKEGWGLFIKKNLKNYIATGKKQKFPM